MRHHLHEFGTARNKIGDAELSSEDDIEVVSVRKEIKQYCFSMAPVVLLFFSMMLYPAFPGHVRFCSGLTFVMAVVAVIAASMPFHMNISDRNLLLKFVSHAGNFNHLIRSVVHVLWLNLANDFIFGRIFTLFILPLSSARQSHNTRSFNVYVCVHVALTVVQFRSDFGDGLPWIVGSIICCSMLVDIALQKEQHQSSRLHLAGAWRTMEKLLSGFCDAVVRLDVNMCIQHPSPQLTHLLYPDGSLARIDLHGKCFADHFASASDRECFEDPQRYNATENTGVPVALQIGLINGKLCKHVELFHVFSKGVSGCEDYHMIGIREMQETVCNEAENATSRASGHEECDLHKDEDSTQKLQLLTLKDVFGSECQLSASSRSSGSSHSQNESSTIRFMDFDMDGVDLDVHSYRVSLKNSSSQKRVGASMVSFVEPEQRIHFTKWLQLSANAILYGVGAASQFGPLYFRIPSRCGGRGSDLFVAKSASVNLIMKCAKSASENDSGNMFPNVRLHCENISRMKLSQSSISSLEPIQEDLGATALRQRIFAK